MGFEHVNSPKSEFTSRDYKMYKAKAATLHATEALGWRGGIAPTQSRPRH
jgi:hypothetical protein